MQGRCRDIVLARNAGDLATSGRANPRTFVIRTSPSESLGRTSSGGLDAWSGLGSSPHGASFAGSRACKLAFQSKGSGRSGWLASGLSQTFSTSARRARTLAWGLVIALLASGSAQALPIVGGGITTAQACWTLGCDPSEPLAKSPTPPLARAIGSIQLDPVGLTLSVQMNVSELSFTGVGSDANPGASELRFLNTIYSAIAVPVIDTGAGYVVESGQTATLSGILTRDGTASGYLATDVLLGGTCTAVGEGVRCGLSFGITELGTDVGTGTPQPRNFFQVAGVTTVPEPSTLLLLGMALLVGAVMGRRV